MTYINIRIYIDKYEYFIWNKKKKKNKKRNNLKEIILNKVKNKFIWTKNVCKLILKYY